MEKVSLLKFFDNAVNDEFTCVDYTSVHGLTASFEKVEFAFSEFKAPSNLVASLEHLRKQWLSSDTFQRSVQ